MQARITKNKKGKTRLEKATGEYWRISRAWNRSAVEPSSITVVEALNVMNDVAISPRLRRLSSIIRNQVVNLQAQEAV